MTQAISYATQERDVAVDMPVQSALGRLDGEIGVLHDQLDRLRERLAPVLGPDLQPKSEQPVNPVPEMCPLAHHADDMRSRVITAITRLQTIISRLEI
jgi:hypothetical protein